MYVVYAILASALVSLVSILVAIPFLFRKEIPQKTLLVLLAVSVGTLLGVVFLDFLPEATSHGYTLGMVFTLLFGFLFMLLVEKLVHFEHEEHHSKHQGHRHAYALAPVNLIGEAVHNFVDGLVIAGSFAVDIGLGIAATVSIALHEIPQEIADLGVLLYAGLSRKRALLFNFISALTAMLGTVVGLVLVGKLSGFTTFILPFAAGNFLYIAASNLTPQLHKECDLKQTFLHLFAICVGVGIIVLIVLYGPGHVHG